MGAEIKTGTIKTLKIDKRFGFIRETGTTKDYFFHKSALEPHGKTFDELCEGDEVLAFQVEKSDKGPRAVAVLVK